MTTLLIMATIGAVLGLILAFGSTAFRVELDLRQETVQNMLPGYNCGACGCPGCGAMAEKIMNEAINLRACKPAKQEQLDAIAKYLSENPNSSGVYIKTKMN